MNNQQNALVESLECYMEEVVESFEDFVKKSLLLFSVGVCTVVLMLVYVLKMLTERGTSVKSSKMSNVWPIVNEKLYPILSTHEVAVQEIKPKVTCSSANTLVMKSIWPSYEEQVLRNIGFSNCHKCMQIGESFDNLHSSFDNLHTQIMLSSDRNRQRAITITPVRRRRDLSLPSKIPDNLRTPALEEIWNIPKVPTMPIPIFDSRDKRQVHTGDESQGDNRDESQVDSRKNSNIELHRPHESKSAYKKDSQRRVQFSSSINMLTRQKKNTNLPSVSWRPRDPVLEYLTAPEIPSDTKAKAPAAKLSWTILTRDAVAFNTHIHRIQYRVSDCGKPPLLTTPGHHRQLLSPAARRCPSPATQPMSPKSPKSSSQKKIPQKFGSFPRHGDYIRTKK